MAIILLLVVLLPALFYSAYEINSLSASEEMVAEIYRRQLDVALYSINQYAWDVVSSWTSALGLLWNESGMRKKDFASVLRPFFEKNQAVSAVFVADSSGGALSFVSNKLSGDQMTKGSLAVMMVEERERIERLLQFSRQNYRKIEPVIPGDSAMSRRPLTLLFVLVEPSGTPRVAGLRLDETKFVNDILASRLREAAGDEFAIGVIRQTGEEILFATAAVLPAELRQRRQLWLFPDLAAGIRLKGATIEDIARSRFRRNLMLILLLDCVLIAGVWFTYRSVRREVDLVRMKSAFVSNVSHELRTPLSLIRMYAETLEMGRVKGEWKRKEYYATIVNEASRLTRLVNNLLNFSRMEAGRKPYTLAPIDLNELVRGTIGMFGPHLRDAACTPLLDLDPALPKVNADAEAVQEVLVNLLDNALKYSDNERYLRVATGKRGESVVVEVEDHGIGIALEHHTKIFETFYRVTDGTFSAAKGSGLGLSIAKHIMDAHGGRIDLASVPGKGSTFKLVFPPTEHR